MTLPDYTSLYHDSTWLYFITHLHGSLLYDGYTFVYSSTSLYYSLPWLYLTLLHTTMALPDSTTLYIWSTLLYFTLLHSIMALFDSTSLYHTLPFL